MYMYGREVTIMAELWLEYIGLSKRGNVNRTQRDSCSI